MVWGWKYGFYGCKKRRFEKQKAAVYRHNYHVSWFNGYGFHVKSGNMQRLIILISGKNPNILKMSLWWEKKRFTLQNENPMLDTGRSCIRQRWRFEGVLTWSWIELRIVLGHNIGGMRVLSSGSEASSGWRIKLEMTDGERKMKNSQINVKRNAIYTFIKKYEVFLQH